MPNTKFDAKSFNPQGPQAQAQHRLILRKED